MRKLRTDVYDDCSGALHLPIKDVPGSDAWVSVRAIHYGDSPDRKYRVKDQSGSRYLIRLTDKTRYDQGKFTFSLLNLLYQNEIPAARPAGFGVCDQNRSVYLMTHWVYGKTAQERLPEQHRTIQYLLGQDAAVYISALHGCKAPTGPELWAQKVSQQIEMLHASCSDSDRELSCISQLLHFVQENAPVVGQQPQCVLHGDLTPDNLICSYESSVSLIDFEKSQFGDPLADLAPVLTDFCRISSSFATGFLDCYFHYQIDIRTFRCLAFYAALRTLKRFVEACSEGDTARQSALQDVKQLLHDYNGFSTVVPAWYKIMPRMT